MFTPEEFRAAAVAYLDTGVTQPMVTVLTGVVSSTENKHVAMAKVANHIPFAVFASDIADMRAKQRLKATEAFRPPVGVLEAKPAPKLFDVIRDTLRGESEMEEIDGILTPAYLVVAKDLFVADIDRLTNFLDQTITTLFDAKQRREQGKSSRTRATYRHGG
jgi:hypothetical protein